jgi:hypothetical protein
MTDYFVYIIHDNTGVPVYVGKGRGYRAGLYNRRNAKIEALISFGGTLPPVKVREGLTEAEAYEVERALIAFHGRADLGLGPLLNLSDGGAGATGVIVSAELRARRGAAHRGKIVSAETRARMSAALKGKTPPPDTPERRAALSAALKGRKPSAACVAALSAKVKGKPLSPEHRARMSESQRRRRQAEASQTQTTVN